MKIALITDTHFGCRGDSPSHLAYIKRFFQDQFFPILRDRGIDTIVHLGDTFDRQTSINFVTLDATRKFYFDQMAPWFRYIQLVGNHCVPFKNTNQVNSVSLVLADYKFETHQDPAVVDIGGRPFLLLPWITADNREKAATLIASRPADVILGHLQISDIQLSKKGISSGPFKPAVFQDYKLVCSGHYHIKTQTGNIEYLGSPYEFTWEDHGQRKGFHILDTITLELEYIENPLKLFKTIIYDDTKKMEIPADLDGVHLKVIVEKRENPVKFDKLRAYLDSQPAASVSYVDREAIITDIQMTSRELEAKDTLTVMSEVVQGSELTVDKNLVLDELKSVYAEANSAL